jgi:signal transduction histidine kinase
MKLSLFNRQPIPVVRLFRSLIFSIIFIILGILYPVIHHHHTNSPDRIQSGLQSKLIEKEKKVLNLFGKTLANLEIENIFRSIESMDNLGKEGIFLFKFQDDSLVFWSSNAAPIHSDIFLDIPNDEVVLLDNGWYWLKRVDDQDISLVGLIEIYYDYPYENDLLNTGFFDGMNVPEQVSFSQSQTGYPIYSADSVYLFSLNFPGKIPMSETSLYLMFLFYLMAYYFLILAIYYAYIALKFFKPDSLLLFVLFLVDVIILRLIIRYFEIPGMLYDSILFDPVGFSSTWLFSSLGDTIVNIFTLLTASYIFYKTIHLRVLEGKPPLRIFSAAFLIVLLAFVFFAQTIFIHGLVRNSSFSFNLQSIYSLQFESFLGFLVIAALLLSYFLLSRKIIRYCRTLFKSERTFYILLGAMFVLFLSISFITPYIFYADVIILFVLLASFFPKSRSRHQYVGFGPAILYLLVFSIYTNIHLNYENRQREIKYRELLLSELINERDPALEFEFRELSRLILNDTVIKTYLRNDSYQQQDFFVENYITDTYFNELSAKYRIQVTYCGEDEILEIQPEGFLIACYQYFDTIVATMGKETLSPNLYFLEDQSENNNYLAIYEIKGQNTPVTKFFVELYSRLIPEEGLGYPELLIDQENNFISDLSDYSFARFRDGKLTYKYGDYPYSLKLSAYPHMGPGKITFAKNGYDHLLFRVNDGNYLIISKEMPDTLGKIAPFSYLFVFFSLFVLVFLLFIIIPNRFRNFNLYFRDRLQFSIITIIILSFIVIGITSRVYILRLNETKNVAVLKEKMYSVRAELENKLIDESVFSINQGRYLMEQLYRFSLVLFSDINLYDTNGSLIASSRPEIFEKGLIANRMDPSAFIAMRYQEKLEFVNTEYIGKQEYLSSYTPFLNENDEVIAYLNLPYFSKQRDIQKEIASFLITYINIYILAIIFTLIVTIVVSTYVTRPLELIKQKMRNVRLGKMNEKIEWMQEDEIGSLVQEYNRMLDELEESAEKLARSEREIAWREMAQQVAHEIKNPLTPMRLSVQHLKRAWEANRADWSEYLEKFSKNLIEQIDNLSQIAGAFSDFASMPHPQRSELRMDLLVHQVADLYKDFKNVNISVEIDDRHAPYFIYADKQQMTRVLHNLIKNSIQAIGEKPEGEIAISITRKEDQYILSISDNGIGIDPDKADQIFRPSFTTKSSGMGLGLAIVRSIIESFDGRIDFTSDRGKGTSFYLYLPVFQHNA